MKIRLFISLLVNALAANIKARLVGGSVPMPVVASEQGGLYGNPKIGYKFYLNLDAGNSVFRANFGD
ncbi:MAG: hypothetical protein LBT42_07025 [Tannerella sp.]|nr:hypothetical protein [Tannerella sp.]